MSDELFKLFGLEKPPTSVGPQRAVPDNKPRVEATPVDGALLPDTALLVDKFDRDKGAELHRSRRDATLNVEAWADFWAAAFHVSPQLLDGPCLDSKRQEFIQTLLETPEYHALHQDTAHNLVPAKMAAVRFAKQFQRAREGDADLERKERQAVTARQKEEAKQDRKIALMAAVAEAVQEAQEDADELEAMMRVLGQGPGEGGRPLRPEDVARVFERVRGNAKLREIIDRAGRYRRCAQARQKQKMIHGYDDMVGVTVSDDPDRILDSELVMLTDPDFGLETLIRLVNKETMAKKYHGIEKVGKGPIIIVVDESGSMQGEPEWKAKAFALAMAWVARHQKRYCALIGYSGSEQGTLCILPPGSTDDKKLFDWLLHFYGRGTNMDVPLRELPDIYWPKIGAPKGKTDLILITDAYCTVPTQMRDHFNAWKAREQVKCITIVLSSDAGDLKQVSDEVHLVDSIEPEGEAAQSCFAI